MPLSFDRDGIWIKRILKNFKSITSSIQSVDEYRYVADQNLLWLFIHEISYKWIRVVGTNSTEY